LAGGSCNSRDTSFQGGNTFFEDIDSRVHNTTVDVAELLEPEEACAMGRVIEGVGLVTTERQL
jgi:hypothetical protein